MLGINSMDLARVVLGGVLILLIGDSLSAIVAVAVQVFRAGFRQPVPAMNSVEKALSILQERYDCGEITKAQYDRLRRSLVR